MFGIRYGRVVLVFMAFLMLLYFSFSNQPAAFTASGWKLIGIATFMILLWISEILPFAIIALAPIILIPVLGIGDIQSATRHYSNPVIFLFLGGFLLAAAMERTLLHRRIALTILKQTGKTLSGILFGFMLATAFLSMWISNTATTVMMTAIAIPAIEWIFPETANRDDKKYFASILLLAIAYSAGVGGTATIIGTPPNAVLFGLLSSTQNIELGFLEWMIYGFPLACIMFTLIYVIYKRKLKRLELKLIDGKLDNNYITEYPKNGHFSNPEKIVAVVFCMTVFLWFTREWINELLGRKILDDTVIAVLGGVLPFIIPVSFKKLDFAVKWEDTRDLPWSVLLLFGGGLTLADAMIQSGLIDLASAEVISVFGQNPIVLLIFLPLIMLLLTEFLGNVALASIFLPLTFIISNNLNLPVQYLAFPVAIASSYAFMLPIATPPNAIVYSKGYFTIPFMVKRGFWLNILGWLSIIVVSYIYFKIFY